MVRLRFALIGIGLALMLVTPVSAQAVQTLRIGQKADLGRFITDSQGRTLYLFTRDAGTTSACVDACLTTWPPLVQASGNPTLGPGLGGTVGVAVQSDGRRQVTYNGKLLYYYRNDVNPGDTNGQNVGGVWFVVEAVAGASALPATGGAPAGVLGHIGWITGLAGLAAVGAGAMLRRRRA
jgi:predicted lipoprotein with Yx(FWY)xxD motif